MLRLDINLVFTIINILVWYAVIRLVLFKRINKVIDLREQAIQSRYDEAEKLRAEAEAEKAQYAASQAGIEQEKSKVMDQAQKDARKEYGHILEEAHKKADQIIEDSKKEAALEKDKILARAEQDIRSLILGTAVQSMQASDSSGALYDEFLTKAGEAGHGKDE